MKSKKINDTFIISLERGEKLIATLKDFCNQNKVFCGYLFGIGALDEVELSHYIVKNKKYASEIFRQPLEIVNLSGNITTMNNEVYLHCHATLGDVNMEAIAGHLKEGIVSATCEIFLVKLDANIERKYDDFIGLNLMEL